MLTTLSIQNVVLIDQLNLNCAEGLSVLTGETGAGKSILLDALGLALGYRGDAKLVRNGTDKASVTAEFELLDTHPSFKILNKADMSAESPLILRRVVGTDGKSRAFINDQPVSIGLLRQIGESLVEIHGQFETQGLLDPKTHRGLLDSYGGLGNAVQKTRATWDAWKTIEKELAELRETLEQALREEEFLRHSVEELDKAGPEAGEETHLTEARALVMNRDKLITALNTAYDALAGDGGADDRLGTARHNIDSAAEHSGGRLDGLSATLARAEAELSEAMAEIQSLSTSIENDGQDADEIEERLFLLKDLARKHSCEVEDLPALQDKLQKQLGQLENQEGALAELEAAAEKTRALYIKAAEKLHDARIKAAGQLDKAVGTELPPLKLDKAGFETDIAALDEENWGPYGQDRVQFLVRTNPGTPAGPINKIASGGELARFMLAIKVVLAATSTTPTLIFDEVDSGIGGATADAVGDRLKRLSDGVQVLVITHSPQVAAQGDQHWIVQKSEKDKTVTTTVVPLAANDDRQEEIARMLSGADITPEARAQAKRLIDNK